MPSVFQCQYPQQLRTREETLIDGRRAVSAANDAQKSRPVVGLAFSGGGIRSATFCLGVLRALAGGDKADPNRISLRSVDLLSTVSGGGYVGAFLGALFSRQGATPDDVERQLSSPRSRAVHWLRENGRYLAPNGAGDQWLAGSTVLRNWVALAIVMGVTVLAVLMTAQAVRLAFPAELNAAFDEPVFSIYWSPWLLAPLAVLLFVATPLGWAYWLGVWQATKVDHGWVWATTIVVTVGAAITALVVALTPPFDEKFLWMLIAFAAVGALTLLCALVLNAKADGNAKYVEGQRTFRNLASRALTGAIIATAALLGLALIDTIGQTAYVMAQAPHVRNALLSSLAAAIVVLITAGQKIATLLDKGGNKKRVSLPLALIAGLAGLFVTFVILSGLSAVSHEIARGPQTERCDNSESRVSVSLSAERYIVVGENSRCEPPPLPEPDGKRTAIAAIALLVLTWFLGRSFPFVNLSSLAQFYSARLSRTYIGASNETRQRRGATMTEEIPGDDFEMYEYAPQQHGGPIHLINVTLNETVGGRSQVEDRDRKGLAMAVGPAGVSVGVRHHAAWKDGTRMAEIEPIAASESDGDSSQGYHIWSSTPPPIAPKRLSLSQWTSISGAAVAPGMGAQTSLGLSLLLGIGNVRLGYWWDSKAEPDRQGGVAPKPSVRLQRLFSKTLPVQSSLMQELLAQFHGPHRQYWYLSDGGHFENTACYELLRRRVPLIVICDDGADPGYGFADLANLVRKARLDFNADIKFMVGADTVTGHFQDLIPKAPHGESGHSERQPKIDLGIHVSAAHVMLARVDYPDGEQMGPGFPSRDGKAHSLIVILKPTLTGDEPLDVLQYAASHTTFPQETTADQFFDEAQWESYRRLGEHIGHIATTLDIGALWAKVSDEANLSGTDI
jgi:hypothetical protein